MTRNYIKISVDRGNNCVRLDHRVQESGAYGSIDYLKLTSVHFVLATITSPWGRGAMAQKKRGLISREHV
jgi:hypothetical protein